MRGVTANFKRGQAVEAYNHTLEYDIANVADLAEFSSTTYREDVPMIDVTD